MEEMMMFFYELILGLLGRWDLCAIETPSEQSSSCAPENTGTSTSSDCSSVCPTPLPRRAASTPVQPTPSCRLSFSSPVPTPIPSQCVIKVAIAGPVGSGKTTLARAMVGLGPLPETEEKDPSVPPVAKTYTFPTNHLIQIWDLPGSPDGTQDPDLTPYQFFILTASSRMNDEVARLARDIRGMEKGLIFVRTMLDVYMQETKQENFGQSSLLKEVRKHFGKKLQNVGVQNPSVFLLSAILPNAYDFQEFMEAFAGQFSSG